jgi:DNA-binding transcriptional MocR family regulator
MSSPAKYINIAQQIISKIEKGQIKANSKLPSLRAFCLLHHISMTTALACYRYLEQHNYIIAEYKKGYFVQTSHAQNSSKNAPFIPAFPSFQSTVAINLSRPTLQLDSIIEYSFATAQLDVKLMDNKLLKRSIKAATKHPDFNLGYDEIQGSNKLRQQLSKHFNKQGFSCPCEELVITYGCLDAVLIALECVSKPGDVIAITSPCYSGLLDLLAMLNRSVLEIPSTTNGVELEQLELAMKSQKVTACLLTANHQNPTGHSLSNQQKQALVTLATEYQIPIIEDDVYREISHQRTVPLPMKYFDQQGWVIWCSSVSKTLAAGLRVGWCLPGRFQHQFIQQRMIRTLGHNQPTQLALADYIGKGYYATHIKKVNKALAQHCTDYIKFLQHNLPKQSEIFMPNGGLVLWVKIPGVNTEKLAIKLSKQSTYIKPGNLFSTTRLYQDCIRLNIGLIPTEQIYLQLALLCQLTRNALTEPDQAAL